MSGEDVPGAVLTVAPDVARQEWTLRLLGILSVLGLVVIGYVASYHRPESPEIVTAVVQTLTMVVGAVVGAQAALSPPATPKVQ